ncbi:MAG: hypothetical protein JO316_21790 [Abitibacteriaceae bacterium]|nr:hypothetical protein [Abditibacteriaceae bacterium]MBV9867997.1 hypothetical protein [Abditibacteriaceae bacterium]
MRHAAEPQELVWSLAPESPNEFWFGPRLNAGVYTFRAKFKPLTGPLAGQEFTSKDVSITVREPQTKDQAAYNFLKQVAALDDKFSERSSIWDSGNHLSRSNNESLLQHEGDSLYAFYGKLILAEYLNYQDEDLYQTNLEEIVNGAPRDFPLLADTYADLIEHYKITYDFPRLIALIGRAKQEQIASANPETTNRLKNLLADAEKVMAQKELVQAAALITAARMLAKQHPLTLALATAYGKARQPGTLEGYSVGSHPAQDNEKSWGMMFYDPRQSWPLMVKYYVNKIGILDRVEFSGALESLGVGPFKEPIIHLKEEHSLDSRKALKVFAQVTIRSRTIEGQLTLPEQRKVNFAIPFPQG